MVMYTKQLRRLVVALIACFTALTAWNLIWHAYEPAKSPTVSVPVEIQLEPLPPVTPVEEARPPQAAPTHTYQPDGLLVVNPDGPHPIFELMEQAEREWNAKLAGVSKTLEEAVTEYKRRYRRSPPLGFDEWWNYAQQHNIQLPDEYDFIWRDLEPFWGFDPIDLQRIQSEQERKTDSYTLGKNASSPISVVTTAFSGTPESWEQRHLLRGADEIMDLSKDIEHLIPPFRAVISPHDNPQLLSDYTMKRKLLDAAAAGTYVDVNDLTPGDDLGYVSACAPSSPARQKPPIDQTKRPPPSSTKTFIHDHYMSMDACLHPQLFYHHSEYIPHRLGPKPEPVIAPQFSYCSSMLWHDIQPPTFISWVDDIYPRESDPEWDEKTDERMMWRGSNTGMNFDRDELWQYSQRPHLVTWANEPEGTVNVLMPTNSSTEKVGAGALIRKALLNPAVNDIAFTGYPIGCEPEYCEYLAKAFEWRRKQDAYSKEAGSHKYFVDVDGNGWSSRFKRLITSNSLVFKATIYPEWYLDRIAPWVHYVPVQVDFSDLYDTLLFFRGGLYGEGGHDDLARKIATAGREWSKSFWRKEDMTAYMFRQLLEYARLMSTDRDAMSYKSLGV